MCVFNRFCLLYNMQWSQTPVYWALWLKLHTLWVAFISKQKNAISNPFFHINLSNWVVHVQSLLHLDSWNSEFLTEVVHPVIYMNHQALLFFLLFKCPSVLVHHQSTEGDLMESTSGSGGLKRSWTVWTVLQIRRGLRTPQRGTYQMPTCLRHINEETINISFIFLVFL